MSNLSDSTIMIVDDTPENLRLLARALSRQGYGVRAFPNGSLALKAAAREAPDLMLLDILMPNMSGFEVCRQLKQSESMRDIPVLFISALGETQDKVEAFAVGGVDYVTKPFQFEEVMARVETHLKLRRARLQIQESYNLLQSLEQLRTDLVHMIVHDMRGPLSVMLLNLDTLYVDLKDQLDTHSLEDIGRVRSSAWRLKMMAETMLKLSQLEAGHMPIKKAECDLVQVVHDAITNAQALDFEREIFFTARGPLRVHVDMDLSLRVIENLIINGLKHTPDNHPLRVILSRTETQVRLAVIDQGQGIPETLQDRIFQKFETGLSAKNDPRSIGLGLSFCKMAIEAHGGQIGVYSAEGSGSTFWFTLPL